MKSENGAYSETHLAIRVLRHAADRVIVLLEGEIDLTNVDQLDGCLQACIGGGARHISVDMAGVAFIDSSGLKALVNARNSLGPTGRIVIREPSSVVRRVLSLSGLDQCLPMIPPSHAPNAYDPGEG